MSTRLETDLSRHIDATPMCDTHEHLKSEREWVENGPDILQDLFGNYVEADLAVAGASPDALQSLMDAANPDIAERFRGIQRAWESVRWTGYGEAVRLLAERIYGLAELTPEGLESAQCRSIELRRPGERLRLLRDVARLDHVQIDNFCWPCGPDASGFDFFLYDLSWVGFCNGEVDRVRLAEETGVTVNDLKSLDEAMEGLFAKYAPYAIAVKSQHAYNRTLKWEPRAAGDARQALERILTHPEEASEADRLSVGDWCLARGVELSTRYDLPFKLHTGYYAGHSRMPVERIRPGNLCTLLAAYPKARFVLMHIAYPYDRELLALAKQYPNVWVDLCWAWAIDPCSTTDFVRRFLHTAPINKVFGFGGDTFWPTSSVAYALQARRWLSRALQAEIDDHFLTEPKAITVASRLMRENQYDFFDLDGIREANATAG